LSVFEPTILCLSSKERKKKPWTVTVGVQKQDLNKSWIQVQWSSFLNTKKLSTLEKPIHWLEQTTEKKKPRAEIEQTIQGNQHQALINQKPMTRIKSGTENRAKPTHSNTNRDSIRLLAWTF